MINDCNNNTISRNNANDNSEKGIHLYNSCDNNTISENTASIFGATFQNYGIVLNNCDNNTIYNNTANNNYLSGILLNSDCDYNRISGNTASNDGTIYQDTGITLFSSCANNTISDNTANNNTKYGIRLFTDCSNNTINNNTLNDNSDIGICLWTDCDDNIITDNIANNNYNFGIKIYHSLNAELSKNQMIGSGVSIEGLSGLFAQYSSHTIYANNTMNEKIIYYYVNENGLGAINFTGGGQVILINCSNSLISNLNLSHTSTGIYLYDCDNNTITGNTANNNTEHGIYLANDCANNTITGNTANATNYYGIYLENDCDNNTISGNTANNNDYYGIYLYSDCGNNTISGNTANDNDFYGITLGTNSDNNTITENNVSNVRTTNQNRGISLSNCDDNTISGNIANNNTEYGISLSGGCDNNTISGNTANNNTQHGIYIWVNCDNNTISGNTANNNTRHGICVLSSCNGNMISGNIIYYNSIDGIQLHTYCDYNNITDNYIYFSGAYSINIYTSDCDNTIIERNVLVSNKENFVTGETGNTIKRYNHYGVTLPSLNLEGFTQSFSTTEFVVTINFSSPLKYLETSNFSIQAWWNGDPVPSNDITELGKGSYKILLTPILINPGDPPILLNMTISAAHHADKYFELEFAVDPEAVDKGADGGDEDVDDGEGGSAIPFGNYYLLFLIGGAMALIILKQRKFVKN